MLAALTVVMDVDVKIYDAESNEISRTAGKNFGHFMADLLFCACHNSMDMSHKLWRLSFPFPISIPYQILK